MARTTTYLVQAFEAGRGKQLKANAAIPCRSAEAANRTAEKLVASKLGVVAYSVAGDADAGEWDDEANVIFKSGRLPSPFGDE
jgi:hypothetical protein